MDQNPSQGQLAAGQTDGRAAQSPWFRERTTHAQEHDLVLLMVAGQKRYLITLRREIGRAHV